MKQKLALGPSPAQRLSQRLQLQLRILSTARRDFQRFFRDYCAKTSTAMDWVEGSAALDDRLVQILSLEGDSSAERRRAIEELVGNIGPRGYLELDPAEIALRADVPLSLVEELRMQLKNFEARAIGSLDFREFFLFQCASTELREGLLAAAAIVRSEKRQRKLVPVLRLLRSKLAKDSFGNVMECLRRGRLKMHPSTAGLSVATETTLGAPDLIVEFDGSNLSARVLPELTDCSRLPQNISEALEKRKSLLLRMGEFLLERQKQFFLHGPAAAAAMEQVEAANWLAVAPSTVSRALSGKVMRTHHGLFRLEKFFSRGTYPPIAMDWFFFELFRENPSALLYCDREIIDELFARFSVKISRRTACEKRRQLLSNLA